MTETIDLIEALRIMVRIRVFEEEVRRLFAAGRLPGFVHLYAGQEAIAVGMALALDDNDQITSTHRGHGHLIARGADLGKMFAELLGRADGYCKGKGGSMHIVDFSRGILGTNGIVGGGIPIATGAALASHILGDDRVTVSMFGDGAANEGVLFECMNLAALWNLPVTFLCENNQYTEWTSTKKLTAGRIVDRATAFTIPSQVVDGNSLLAVHKAVVAGVERARAGNGPTFIEAETYRHHGHNEGEEAFVGDYRPRDEVSHWLARDPIHQVKDGLIADGVLDEGSWTALWDSETQSVRDALAAAQVSPFPSTEEAYTDVFTDAGTGAHTPTPSGVPMTEQTYFIHAMRDGIADAMREDPTVVVMGEDADRSVTGATRGLVDEFGPDRVRNIPLSEAAVVGTAVGAAATGLRPVVDLMVSSFFYLTMDQLANQAAKLRYMSGGQVSLPIVYFASTGPSSSAAAQHSESPHPIFMQLAGIKVVMPSTPAEARGLMLAAIRDPNPVIYLQEGMLAGSRGPVPDRPVSIPLGQADIKREGADLTVVAVGALVPRALSVVDRLAERGEAQCEVVDPRTLNPLDRETILASVEKTGRLVVLDLARRTCGAAAEIIATVTTEAFHALKGPPIRITLPDIPIPFSPELEKAVVPDEEAIEEALLAAINSTHQ
jgi:2-oxoisovalerate dehydrogenase E1 component